MWMAKLFLRTFSLARNLFVCNKINIWCKQPGCDRLAGICIFKMTDAELGALCVAFMCLHRRN